MAFFKCACKDTKKWKVEREKWVVFSFRLIIFNSLDLLFFLHRSFSLKKNGISLNIFCASVNLCLSLQPKNDMFIITNLKSDMKKRLLTMSVLAALSGNAMADGYAYMQFTLADGTTQLIAVDGLSLSFDGGTLTAGNGTETLTIPLSNMKSMAFTNGATTGIDAAMTSDDTEEIYDLKGHRVTRAQMRKGVYIIKTKNRTYKVNVR